MGTSFSNSTASTFVSRLRLAIRRFFGSQAAFAEAAGLSEGRISQLLSDREDSVAYKTLNAVLNVIPDVVSREEIYQAWQRRFSPTPSSLLSLNADSPVSEIYSFLDMAERLVDIGQWAVVLSNTRQLWEG